MNSTVNSTIAEAARQQERLQQQRMRDFCTDTFLQNLFFQVGLFVLLSVIFKYGLLDQLRLKLWDALRLRQVRARGAFQVFRLAVETILFLGRPAFQDSFIRKYGLEIFNYLTFLTRILLAAVLFFVYTLVSSLAYFLLSHRSFRYWDFWIGYFDFRRHALYVSLNAFACAGLMLFVLRRLQGEVRAVQTRQLLQGIDDPESQQGLLLRSVFLSVDEPVSEPTHLKAEIARVTDSPRPDPFRLLYFPHVHKIWRWRIKLKKLREMQLFRIDPGTLTQRLLGQAVQHPAEYFKAKIREFEAKYNAHLQKQVAFTSQGLLLFYRFEDVFRFWKALHPEKTRLEDAPPLADSNQLALVTPAHRFVRHTQTYFLSSYSDLIVGHMHEYRFRYRTVQLLTYLVLIITLLFLTTPIAAIKNFTPLLLGSTVAQTIFKTLVRLIYPLSFASRYATTQSLGAANQALMEEFVHSETGSFLAFSFFPLFLILVNILVSFLIERIGSWQKLPRHSLFHLFVFRLFWAYYMVNLFVVPGLLNGSTSSLFEVLLLGDTFGPNRRVWSWRFYKSGTFYSSLIVQSSIVRLFSDLLMVVPFVNTRFSYHRMAYRLKHVRRNNGDKQISDVYTFGYNYAMEAVMFALIYVFGLSQPLIFFSGLTYAAIRCFSSAVVLSLFYKKQVYMNTAVFDEGFGRLFLAVPSSFLVLSLKFWSIDRHAYAALHLAAFLLAGLAYFRRRHKAFTFEDFAERVTASPDHAARLLADTPLSEEERVRFLGYYREKVVDKLVLDKLSRHGLL